MSITTSSILPGAQHPNPHPVTELDYAGQPIKPGGYYNGKPEHQGPLGHMRAGITPRKDWSPAMLEAARKRMAHARSAWRQKKRAAAQKAKAGKAQAPASSPSVDPPGVP